MQGSLHGATRKKRLPSGRNPSSSARSRRVRIRPEVSQAAHHSAEFPARCIQVEILGGTATMPWTEYSSGGRVSPEREPRARSGYEQHRSAFRRSVQGRTRVLTCELLVHAILSIRSKMRAPGHRRHIHVSHVRRSYENGDNAFAAVENVSQLAPHDKAHSRHAVDFQLVTAHNIKHLILLIPAHNSGIVCGNEG